ncbi:tRNA methyltransferase [Irpex rosettiformis]|uniref:tRNA methyltransferase n=1 Tax=Irpex rosettiformis TaxID=378272 RepID=A0ACB8UHM9_9APHY|nr:tRNA methyltransferase [Irpex rosettiformis]
MSLPQITVPEGYTLHSENTAHILLPNDNGAFLNPVQEFNRDLSVACITTWGQQRNEVRKKKQISAQEWRLKRGDKGRKTKKKARTAEAEQDATAGPSTSNNADDAETSMPVKQDQPVLHIEAEFKPKDSTFTILEALSATGLRSIRYAKEIPLVQQVIANDLSSTAAEAMRRNVELNGLGVSKPDESEEKEEKSPEKKVRPPQPKVRVNEGDACALMYNHRAVDSRVDVVDLDPYGTAAPFIDAAVQCVADDGLLCVTCTDLAVLASTNYSEKCFSNYGGVSVKAEYCHESALRLVLHTVSTSAARYGRYIEPLLSLSIDFYVRLFIRVTSSPIGVKRLASKNSTYYVCTHCQSFYDQPLGKIATTMNKVGSGTHDTFKTHSGPPVGDRCPECNSHFHIAGPMWNGPIHNKDFVSQVLEHIEANESKYGTSPRMKGMLTVAKEELDTPFYFTPSKIASFFHCVCPSLNQITSALLHLGHPVSRSHACPGSVKTAAGRDVIHDIYRTWVKENPVKMDKISEASPARVMLAKEAKFEANFEHHPDTVTQSSKVKVVRYQQNPAPNWGPGTKASSGGSNKRKRQEEGEDE